MRVVRTPAIAKRLFTPNELSGWSEGVRYTCTPRRERRKRERPQVVEPAINLSVRVVSGGVEAQEVL